MIAKYVIPTSSTKPLTKWNIHGMNVMVTQTLYITLIEWQLHELFRKRKDQSFFKSMVTSKCYMKCQNFYMSVYGNQKAQCSINLHQIFRVIINT